MQKTHNIGKWQLAGAVFTLLLGTLLHFVYQWTGGNMAAGIFSPVSESTWEHLKMLFFPAILSAAAEYIRYGREIQNFIPVRLLSILLGMAVIVTLFYTYSGILGTNFLWADIATFIAGVAAIYLFSRRFLGTHRFNTTFALGASVLVLLVLLLCFVLFTFRPPRIGLFLDPTSLS